jgi:hypothetical protein
VRAADAVGSSRGNEFRHERVPPAGYQRTRSLHTFEGIGTPSTELRMQNPQDTIVVGDPFAMLINPQAVLIAIEQSGRLGALNSRVCRPLDKPLIPKRDNEDQQRTLDDIADGSRETVSDSELGTIY